MSARQKIREYINSNLVVLDDEAEFEDADNIFQKGYVNSLFAMKLLNFVESEFQCKVDDSDIVISNFSSVDNIINLVKKKKDIEE
ncbi:MAG: hypothetical protein JXR70_07460 [Spirochaetales bacterium]|nr:hypothetical protein [Spirochaetales bacterium]